MPIDLHMLGTKLRKYRDQFQLTPEQVASATGLSSTEVVSFEDGQKQPTGDQILILADFFRCDYRFFISNEKLAPFEQTENLFRKHSADLSREDRWAIQEFLFLCECEAHLLEMLHRQPTTSFHFVKRGTYFKGHGEQLAEQLRRFLGYDDSKVGVDVYADFRKLGVHVFRRRLENSGISGLFVKHPTAGKCVLVNYSEDIYRQRFSAAHEGGHSQMDDDQDFVVSFAKSARDLSEIRANTFASRYLLPPAFLRQIPDPHTWPAPNAIDWANRLKVSAEAFAYALKEADLIDDGQVAQIKAARVPTADKNDPELPANLGATSIARKRHLLEKGLSDYYVGLCFDAYDAELVSAGRLSEMLLVDHSELGQLAAVYGRSVLHGN